MVERPLRMQEAGDRYLQRPHFACLRYSDTTHCLLHADQWATHTQYSCKLLLDDAIVRAFSDGVE